MKKKVLNIVGARPNFMKIGPIHKLLLQSPQFTPILIHTGQHYDRRLSDLFFRELELPKPDRFLGVGSGTHAEQTGKVMVELEKVMVEENPDLVLVVGDVNSTLAGSLVAAKLWIPVAHVEAGLRSFDRTMPEEINRICTDAISDYLFVSEQSGVDNLKAEGVLAEKVHFVGNVMIDSLLQFKAKAQQVTTVDDLGLKRGDYALLTLHRPSNVDNGEIFNQILNALEQIQEAVPILFPIHPRTRKMMEVFSLNDRMARMKNLKIIDPIGYLEFLSCMMNSRFVLTDSGGIQEETTVLGVPCLTLRQNTERPSTVEIGTNQLVGMDVKKIVTHTLQIINGEAKQGGVPPLWDGHAADRIVKVLGHRYES